MPQQTTLVSRLTVAAIARLSVLILGLSFQILIAKAMLPEEYAKFAVALAGSVLFASLASLGVARAVSRFLPVIMACGSTKVLSNAAKRYAAYRFAGILVVACATWIVLDNYPIISNELQFYSQAIIVLWFIFLMLQMDAEALAHGLMEYNIWSAAILLEVLSRIIATAILLTMGQLDADGLITVWLLTSAAIAIGVPAIIVIRKRREWLTKAVGIVTEANLSLRPQVQRSFALGIYLSSFGWLITSPAAIRLVSATALPVIPLAAISFVQGLVTSAQRALPVHLLALAIEPVLINKSATCGKVIEAQRILSLLAKSETILVLLGIAVITPISTVVLALTSRQEFGPYGYVIPIILAQSLGTSYYRLLEILAGISLKHHLFARIAPLSVGCLLLVFLTTPYIGVASILVWPSIELMLRLGIMKYALRYHGARRVLDLQRLAPLVIGTVGILALCELAAFEFEFGNFDRVLASIFSGASFVLLLFIVRPIRLTEYRLAKAAFPNLHPKMLEQLQRIVR